MIRLIYLISLINKYVLWNFFYLSIRLKNFGIFLYCIEKNENFFAFFFNEKFDISNLHKYLTSSILYIKILPLNYLI